jgi:putative membrane protein
MLNALIAFIACLHVYFLILEMFLWTRPRGLKVFGQSLEKAKSSATLAANQGLYNGFLAAGLFWSLLHPSPDTSNQIKVFFLSCVFLAGLYGGYSVNKKIMLIQALPSVIALVLLAFT